MRTALLYSGCSAAAPGDPEAARPPPSAIRRAIRTALEWVTLYNKIREYHLREVEEHETDPDTEKTLVRAPDPLLLRIATRR